MLIFDFDGVLINSVNESIPTAHNAATGTLQTDPAAFSANYIQLARNNRFHVRPAGDFIPFANWCIEHQHEPDKLLSTAEYKNILASTQTPLVERTKFFFEMRTRFMKAAPQNWMDLNQPYQPLWDHFKRLTTPRIILTNKNKQAVLSICSHFGVELDPNNIYPGDNGTTKRENLNQIIKRFGADNYTFVDDSISNLLELKESAEATPPCRWLLADWGYVGPEDGRVAVANQIEIISQETLLKSFELR